MKTSAIIQAAGGGTRFHSGRHKLLMELDGKSIIRHSVELALATGYAPVIVVTGALQALIAAELEGYPVQLVQNPRWEQGQSTSLRAGVAALPQDVDTVCMMLGDQPKVALATIRALQAEQEAFPESIIVPTYQGKRGNPTFFPKPFFQRLLNQPDNDYGGRAMIRDYGARFVAVDDPLILRDIDTIEDFQAFGQKPAQEAEKEL